MKGAKAVILESEVRESERGVAANGNSLADFIHGVFGKI